MKSFIAILTVLAATLGPVARATEEPIRIPVAFDVVNSNTSKLPCMTDGEEYTIRGNLTALPSVLAREQRAVALYLHGSTINRLQWEMPVPGYDMTWELAKLGHVSVAIDQLGYDASGHPDGDLVCIGGNADVAHQIVTRLRSGEYGYGTGTTGPRFQKVVIGGNSSGGVVAEVEAYSYDDVDGLIIFGAGDWTVSLFLKLPRLHGLVTTCAQGGEPPEDGMTSPLNYAYTWPSAEAEVEDVAYDMPAEVAEVLAGARNRDPCSYQETVLAGLAVNNVYSWQIDVPVLLMYGEYEELVGPQPYQGEVQRAKMIGSDDVTLVINEDEGHVGMIERHADVFRARLSAWLTPRGF